MCALIKKKGKNLKTKKFKKIIKNQDFFFNIDDKK